MFELLQETFTDEDGISTRCFSLVDRGTTVKNPLSVHRPLQGRNFAGTA